ncbi:MAG: GAF domain-containing protein [Thainema sp.]
MTSSTPSSMLAAISQVNNSANLTHRVQDLPTPKFIDLLDQITREFEHFLRAIDMINNENLERMLEQILEAFTLKIGQILQAERTTIFMVDREKKQLWSKIAENSLEIRIPMNKGIAGRVATTGECLNIPDAYSHPLFNPEVDKKTGYRTRNILCLPIFTSNEEVVAVVQLLNKIGDAPFDQQDERSFREFAASIGIILESCNKFYIAARNQKGVEALLKATSCLGQTLDLEKTLRVVMDEARDLMSADRSTLFLLDREKNQLWSKVANADNTSIIELRFPADKGIAGYVASTGETVNIPDAYKDPRFDPSSDKRTGYLTRNILCMPVFNSSGALIGVTQLINKHQGSFTNSDEEFMRAFNIQAGVALENAQLFENVLVEKQYQKDMLQSLSDAVISTDMSGRIVTINDAALQLLGCPLQEKASNEHDSVQNSAEQQKARSKAANSREAVNGKLRQLWESNLLNRFVWEVVPLDGLQGRLVDSLQNAVRQYVPEQGLCVGIYTLSPGGEDTVQRPASQSEANGSQSTGDSAGNTVDNTKLSILAIPAGKNTDVYLPWNRCYLEQVEGAIATPSESESANGNGHESAPAAEAMPWPRFIPAAQVQQVERSINLTVNPLTNPEGGVRGGLIVLEDISQEKRMKTTLYRYMTPGVAERVMALGEDALMEGERKEVTILFSDIRGYTTLTENLEAAEVVRLLNDYFETMVEAVFDCEGTLDKFIGDALMAVFGAPLPLENHALAAVKSALDMRHRLVVFNRERAGQSEAQIRIGIGISSGEVVSGNIGSQKKMEYTVIGDGVNLSSRLESITKQYGCDIVISEHTYEMCKPMVWVRELDLIRVKGKNEPVGIYDVLDFKEHPLSADLEAFLEMFRQGRAAYTNGNFEQAIRTFKEAYDLSPQALGRPDEACKLFINRSEDYKAAPPPDDWGGVFTMKNK